MLRIREFGGNLAKKGNLEKGKSETINMERANGLKNITYDFHLTIKHDNASALSSAVDVYKFVKNFLLNIKFQTGAGDNLFDLQATELLILNLMEQGRLRYNIDTTAGEDKASTIFLRWDFRLPKGYKNRLDTVFHSDSPKYNYVQVKIQPQANFSDIADLTINTIDYAIIETFKMNPTPSIVTVGGKTSLLPAMNKIIKVKDVAFNSSTNAEIVELPKNTNILGIFAFVVDENDNLKSECINSLSIKNGNEYFYSNDFGVINDKNRDDLLKVWQDTNLDNFCYVDIAKGQMSEGLNEAQVGQSNTVLSFDLTAQAGSNILKVMYLTVDDA